MRFKDQPEVEDIPAPAPGPRRPSGAALAGAALFILALVFYYAAVLRIDFKRTGFLDLPPYPDAVEYFAQANSLLSNGTPTIRIGYDRLPSRYPPGYPILMLPWLKTLPSKEKILAPFRTNQTLGLLLLLGTFSLYVKIGRPLAGGLAALLLATQPALVTYSRASMSDLSGAAAALLAIALVYVGLRAHRRGPIYGAAVVLGLSLSIRPQLLFFAPLLVSMALFPGPRSRGHWWFHCLMVLVTYGLAASPYFLFNAHEFGSPLRTGYGFWVPSLTDQRPLFSVHYWPPQGAMLWSEITASWDQFRVANLFGTGTYVVPAFVLLALAGLAFLRFTPFELSALLAGTSFFVATASYRFVDGRFFMPVQFLLVALAVRPVEWALSRGPMSRSALLRVPILVVFLLSCVGYPSQSGHRPSAGRSQAWDALNFTASWQRSAKYVAVCEFRRAFKKSPGIVLSTIDPVYLNALLPREFVAAPVDGKHSYSYSRSWHFGSVDALRLALAGRSRNLPVYALLMSSKDLEQDAARLPDVPGYAWTPYRGPEKKAAVFVLTPNSGATSSKVLLLPGQS